VFFDIETDIDGKSVLDIGAISNDNRLFHSSKKNEFEYFISNIQYAIGHNIFEHDLKYIAESFHKQGVKKFIDTLVFSPLLFSQRPYHKLVKDYKLDTDEVNNPVNDSKLCKELFDSEVDAFNKLNDSLKRIYFGLLSEKEEYKHFFDYVGYSEKPYNLSSEIRSCFWRRMCTNAPIEALASKYPVELAYALALITANDSSSVTPAWVLNRYPKTENVLYFLRGKRCAVECEYCAQFTNEIQGLKDFFRYSAFRLFGGEPLQQNAVKAANENKSLLAVFPTGGGKSITFQLPALMAYRAVKGLTVVISPLQSLMKDQVDNLAKNGITEAATINGQLTTIEIAEERKRVEDGDVAILYISPESLRSKSMETLLLKRNIVRFVIDEAHCFSVWGQDFRVDYQYIGDFIKNYQTLKGTATNIPVSCFTATAKQRVINDIITYFKDKLNLHLELFTARTSRTNLSYNVIITQESEKFDRLCAILDGREKPTIVYVSRTRKAEDLANKLNGHGYSARCYHGQMDNDEKIRNQEAFMADEVRIIIATTAFGMGVDKKDVGTVIHYNISDSLENYVQEAGRAGRDEKMNAECFILFNEDDLDKHFILLNQTKISEKEIVQIWRAIRNETRKREEVSLSALDIARTAGWSDAEKDIETRIKTAVSELEHSGFIQRGQNMPRIYANSINVRNMEEASARIENCGLFDTKDAESAKRIIKSLISAQHIAKAGNREAESRVDYMADNLAIVKSDVIRVIGLLREAGILSDDKDFTVFVKKNDESKIKNIIQKHLQIETAIIEKLYGESMEINLKAFFEELSAKIQKLSMNDIKVVLNYLKIKKLANYHYKNEDGNLARNDYIVIKSKFETDDLKKKCEKRIVIATKITDYIYMRFNNTQPTEEQAISFSRLELIKNHKNDLFNESANIEEIDDALFYLLKIRALKIEGEFLVIYNRMHLKRIANTDDRYKKEHYKHLADYYDSKIKQIHIVGEYARKMIESEGAASEFVDDYFFMQSDFFMHKYFAGRNEELKRNMTRTKFKKLFGELSETQLNIIKDSKSKYIVVVAGPGSGKTKLLTHKLASLYISEDVKHEQMLMLTFSRAAASEFKKRLMSLIGNAANYIMISTFHSYCFDLLGNVGNLEKTDSIIKNTIEAIKSEEVDQNKLGKLVLVIDEAQDISNEEYELINLLMNKNEEMRVIAVGDDDQSIYEFRGASPKYLKMFAENKETVSYELLENYRSKNSIVEFSNTFIAQMPNRLKKHAVKAKNTEKGIVQVIKHQSESLIQPIVNNVLSKMTNQAFCGSAAVLARTNDEVLQIATLLKKNGIHAKTVGDTGMVSIGDLAELRYFYSLLDIDDTQSQISQEAWEKAIKGLKLRFASSEILLECLSALTEFEEINNKSKYINDFRIFLSEAKFENFINVNGGEVFVSTIHQAKGREFDHVFLSLSNYGNYLKDEDRRAIYVALTRAKNNLFVHYNKNILDGIHSDNVEYLTDNNEYGIPNEITIQLDYKNVILDAFFNYQNAIHNIYAGAELSLDDKGCLYGGKRVLLFSTTFKTNLEKFASKGYKPASAKATAIVYWKKTKTREENHNNNENIGKEAKIILPIITLVKITDMMLQTIKDE
jgi:ATP-dependent DNA helicase RecQ